MKRLKFVIVGCGRIAALHVTGYKDNPDAELWGVFDIDQAAAKKRGILGNIFSNLKHKGN
jgi:predicted dehydrogenase